MSKHHLKAPIFLHTEHAGPRDAQASQRPRCGMAAPFDSDRASGCDGPKRTWFDPVRNSVKKESC